ncbi:MAG: hypothetical protein HYT93_00760 [Parcubacteria group bacterium]|nr:hypothetical protein [Parcubacteria group bacterium]
MSLSAFAYAFWLGPWFAIGLVLMIFIHEMGHVIAMRIKGFEATTPVFIPFLGAAIFAPKFENRDDEAYVGYGGPLVGSAAAVILFLIYFLLDASSTVAHIVLITSYAAVFINLFNMIPLSPLDGGRVTQAIGAWFQHIGLLTFAGVSILLKEPVLLLIWILILGDLTFIHIKMRAVLGVFCYASMATLMWAGYSSQPFWVDMFDVVIGGLFIGALIAAALNGIEEKKDARPSLSVQGRLKWLSCYLGLTVALVGLIAYQAQFLPQPQ